MFKIKYLHNKTNKSYKDDWFNKRYKEDKNLNMFCDLPKHLPMKKHNVYNSINWGPLFNFLESKVGEEWNDVYSEIISKTKKRFRHELNSLLDWFVKKPIYNDDFLPMNERGGILSDILFIDMNNVLCMKTKDELIRDAKKIKRKIKLQQILENEKSQEIS